MDQAAYFNQMRNNRQREILGAARQMFLDEGMQGFTMQKLAKQLDVSTVTLYKYYKNSEDILNAIQDEIMETGMLAVSAAEQNESALIHFLNTMERFLKDSVKNREDLRLLFLSWDYSNGSEAKREHITRLVDMSACIIQGQKDGTIRTDLKAQDMWSFVCMTNLAVLERIGLMTEKEYQEMDVKLWITQLMESYRRYLES